MTSRILPWLVVLSLGFVTVLPAEEPAQEKDKEEKKVEVQVGGRVVDPEGKPISGATVMVRRVQEKDDGAKGKKVARRVVSQPGKVETVTVTTDDEGRFLAGGLEGEQFLVRVQTSTHAPRTEDQVAAGADLDLSLQPGYPLAGRVLDLRDQTPLADAEVLVCDQPGQRFGTDACIRATTNEEGAFRFGNLPEGNHRTEFQATAHARKTGHVGLPMMIDPDTEEPKRLITLLGPGGRLAGRVVTTDGDPVEGAEIHAEPAPASQSLRRTSRGWRERARTDDEGRFDLDGLPVTSGVRLTISNEDFARLTAEPIEIQAGTDISDLRFTLTRGATLRLRLIDEEGDPVRAEEISLNPAEIGWGRGGHHFGEHSMEIDDEGWHSVDHIVPGVFRLHISTQCCKDYERERVHLKEGETMSLGDLVLDPGLSISGKVSDTAGRPVEGVLLVALWETDSETQSDSSASGEDGTYRIGGIDEQANQFMLHAQGQGFVRKEIPDVLPGDNDVDIVLERAGILFGTVLRPEGMPAEAFWIEAHREREGNAEDPMGFRSSRPKKFYYADEAGEFVLEDLDPGRYTVIARAMGDAPARKAGIEIETDRKTDAGTLTLQPGITVRGKVVTSRDQAPVPGASVTADASTGMTFGFAPQGQGIVVEVELDGSFEIEGLEPGSVNFQASHPDYSLAEKRIQLNANEVPEEVTLALMAGGRLTGRVENADGGPVEGASILLNRGMAGSDPRTAETDGEGRYDFEKVPPGSYYAALMPDSGTMAGMDMKTIQIQDGETTVLNFGAEARIRVTGRVLLGDEPIPGATIMFSAGDIFSSAIPQFKSTAADAQGNYTVGLDSAGSYQVAVGFGAGDQGKVLRLDIPDQPEVRQDLVLQTQEIQGTVVDPDGNPVPRARITVKLDASAMLEGVNAGQTGGDGSYRIGGLDAGTYRVTVSAEGFAPAELHPIVVSADIAGTADFRLERGTALRGTVVDAEGNPIASAFVLAAGTGGIEMFGAAPTAMTDINGRFEMLLAAGSTVDLSATAQGWAPTTLRGVTVSEDPDGAGVTLRMSLGGRIRVSVVDSGGNPVESVQISVKPLSDSIEGALTLFASGHQPTDAAGTSVIDRLSPGSYELGVIGRQVASPVQVQVPSGGEASAVLTLAD